ncbi:Atp5c1p [Perkinsus chesapeaki]|uniref:ATP synthase subunit gamma, mitochondrial n=1 Tax=Perkinsus chesapeaki TaxID=330153 RepID=A0A7J6MBA1_PERCH|nr:Atp5c1p [Perkinsus chesapeaki]
MSNLKAVKTRMKSVTSIQKITKAMKMVAASKLRSDEDRVVNGMPFAQPVIDFFKRLPVDEGIPKGPTTIVGLTSDKGLCGGVNSSITKRARAMIMEVEGNGGTAKYIGVGGKGTAAMKRLFADRFEVCMEDVQKHPWNFAQASAVAERVIRSKPERLVILSNHFKSVISFDTWENRVITMKECQEMNRTEWSKAVDQYSFEPSVFEVLDDLHDFYVANCVFGYMLDSIAAEQSARMSAMENASKNASDMIDKLNLQFNKARQSKITTELCEIISGASSLLEGCGGCGGCCCGMCACKEHHPTVPIETSELRDRVLRHQQRMRILERKVEEIDCDCDEDDKKGSTSSDRAPLNSCPYPRTIFVAPSNSTASPQLSRQSSTLNEPPPSADPVRRSSSLNLEPPMPIARGPPGVMMD